VNSYSMAFVSSLSCSERLTSVLLHLDGSGLATGTAPPPPPPPRRGLAATSEARSGLRGMTGFAFWASGVKWAELI